jgi:spoIIIJ-associated protein
MDEIEVTGRNIDEIIERAGQLLNCKPEYLEYTVLKEERKGGGPHAGRALTCKVWKREYKTGVRRQVEDGEISEQAGEARDVLQEILRHIVDDGEVVVRESPDLVQLNIMGQNAGLIIGRKGQTLEALQHVLVKIMTQRKRTLDKVIVIDAENYRQRRREMLERMARKLKKEAQADRRPVYVEPMSAFERRIIHLTLSKDRDVYTKSVGMGSGRQVVIVPRGYRGEDFDGEPEPAPASGNE